MRDRWPRMLSRRGAVQMYVETAQYEKAHKVAKARPNPDMFILGLGR